MSHDDLCGRRCRCTDGCCLADDRCICQQCELNINGWMAFPTLRAPTMTHLMPSARRVLSHPTGRGQPVSSLPWNEESQCWYCGRIEPLTRLIIAGPDDTSEEQWQLAVHKTYYGSCPGSGRPSITREWTAVDQQRVMSARYGQAVI